MRAIVSALLLVGCAKPVDITADLTRLTRTHAFIAVQTNPGAPVGAAEATATADDDGRAELEVAVADIVERIRNDNDYIIVWANGDGLFEKRGSDWYTPPFFPRAVTEIPADFGEQWAWAVGYPEVPALACMSLGGALGKAELNRSDNPFAGPPGAHVELGPVSFDIPESGLARWTVDLDALMPSWPVRPGPRQVEVEITARGSTKTIGSATLELRQCAEVVGRRLREAVAEQRPAPYGSDEPRDQDAVILVRFDDTLGGTGPDGVPVARAKFVAIETETGRREGRGCAGVDTENKGSYGSAPTKLVDTEVVLYELASHREVARKTFEGGGTPCPEFFMEKTEILDPASRRKVERWSAEQIAPPPPPPEPSPKRKRRRKR